MSGIPVYTASPVNTASKPSGVTPQTLSPDTQPGVPKPTATGSTSAASYTPAQPGAASVPAPTGASQRYAPVQPTPTTKTDSDAPPPPQPGAFPVPSRGLPPPPKAGERYLPSQHSSPAINQSMPQPYPPQMSIPPPSTAFRAQPPASSTTPATTASSAFPIALPTTESGGPRQSLEHPPGYHQDTYASELTSDQRRAQDANNFTGLGGSSSEKGDGIGADAWNAAKQWASAAGDKLSETEADIWRRINKQ